MYMCMYECVCEYGNARMWVWVCIYEYVCVCLWVCVHAHMWVWVSVYTYVSICMHHDLHRGQRTSLSHHFSPSTLSKQDYSCFFCGEYPKLAGLWAFRELFYLFTHFARRILGLLTHTTSSRFLHMGLRIKLRLSGLHSKSCIYQDTSPWQSRFKTKMRKDQEDN